MVTLLNLLVPHEPSPPRRTAMPSLRRPSLLSAVIRLWENGHDHDVYLDDP